MDFGDRIRKNFFFPGPASVGLPTTRLRVRRAAGPQWRSSWPT